MWHTHLKKRLQKTNDNRETLLVQASAGVGTSSPPQSSSEVSSSTVSNDFSAEENWENSLEISESFWAEALAMDASITSSSFPPNSHDSAFSSEEDDLDFWINILRDGGSMPEMLLS